MSTMQPQNFSRDVQTLSFEDIFSRYHDRIYRYILRLVHQPDEAEDLTQETFLRVHGELSSLRDQNALTSWLYRIATHICYDRFRQSSYHIESQSLEDNQGEQSDTLEGQIEDLDAPKLDQVIDQHEMSTCVQAYISRLSDDHRIAILLHDLHGMTCPEIAQRLGCSLELVKIRLHRARQKLKAVLSAVCDFSIDQQGILVCESKI
jgi:RNA polymerase sigma-70 factor, ECF subfamily